MSEGKPAVSMVDFRLPDVARLPLRVGDRGVVCLVMMAAVDFPASHVTKGGRKMLTKTIGFNQLGIQQEAASKRPPLGCLGFPSTWKWKNSTVEHCYALLCGHAPGFISQRLATEDGRTNISGFPLSNCQDSYAQDSYAPLIAIPPGNSDSSLEVIMINRFPAPIFSLVTF